MLKALAETKSSAMTAVRNMFVYVGIIYYGDVSSGYLQSTNPRPAVPEIEIEINLPMNDKKGRREEGKKGRREG